MQTREERLEYGRRWRAANREKYLAGQRKWYAANRHLAAQRGKEYRDKKRREHGDTVRAREQRWRDTHPATVRAAYRKYNLKRWYGLTQDAVDKQWSTQGGLCAICGDALRQEKSTNIDHHHVTGAFRGLLCRSCNLGVGNFRDDTRRLFGAIQYLQRGGNLS